MPSQRCLPGIFTASISTRAWTAGFSGLVLLLGMDVTETRADVQTFEQPSVRGVRLDWCRHWGRECGGPAAQLFCQENGFVQAQRFLIDENVGARGIPTLVFGDGALCQAPNCSGFRAITCARPDQPESIATPQPPPPAGPQIAHPETQLNADQPGMTITVPLVPLQPTGPTIPETVIDQPADQPNVTVTVPLRPIQIVPPLPPRRPQLGQIGTGDLEFRPDLAKISCAAAPEACCPDPQKATACRELVETLLDVRIRSYVPPRFTVMDKVAQWQLAAAKVVSDISKGSPYNVWPGCRFYPTVMINRARDDQSIIDQMLALGTAWMDQWSSGISAAKGFVAGNIAIGACEIFGNSAKCRATVETVVIGSINAGLASLGIPPNFPDLNQLRDHAIEYLAAEAASAVMGEADVLLEGVPLSEQDRERLYDELYREAEDSFTRELDQIVPTVNVKGDDPWTWGHLDPAYTSHNAHLYVEIRFKPGMHPVYQRWLAKRPRDKWPPFALHDEADVYQSMTLSIPRFLPPGGMILPLELKPSQLATSAADTASDEIPGTPISRQWLTQKFRLDGDVRYSQINYRYVNSANYFGSEYDLFYAADGQTQFRLIAAVGAEGIIEWDTGQARRVGTVWDAETGIGVRTSSLRRDAQLKRYYGLIEPAPRCDGNPTKVLID